MYNYAYSSLIKINLITNIYKKWDLQCMCINPSVFKSWHPHQQAFSHDLSCYIPINRLSPMTFHVTSPPTGFRPWPFMLNVHPHQQAFSHDLSCYIPPTGFCPWPFMLHPHQQAFSHDLSCNIPINSLSPMTFHVL